MVRYVQSPGGREWRNALWAGRGAVYGQRDTGTRRAVTSIALSLVEEDARRDERLAAVASAFDRVGIGA